MNKVVFVKKLTRTGVKNQLAIYVPKPSAPLVEFGKVYKVTLEEIEVGEKYGNYDKNKK